jgi:hypothetical protein
MDKSFADLPRDILIYKIIPEIQQTLLERIAELEPLITRVAFLEEAIGDIGRYMRSSGDDLCRKCYCPIYHTYLYTCFSCKEQFCGDCITFYDEELDIDFCVSCDKLRTG